MLGRNRNHSNPTGGDGLMTSFVGWRQAFESAVMAGSDSMGRSGMSVTVNRNRRFLEYVLAGVAFGALTLGSPAMAADIPLKAPYLRPAFDWSGFYIGGHTGYGRGSSFATLTDPAFATTNSVVSGVIGGVQAGYNYRLSLRPAVRRRSRSDLSELPAVESRCRRSRRRAPTSKSAGTMSAPCAAASATPAGLGWSTPPAGFAWAGERFLNTPTGVDVEEKHINVRPGWAAGAGLEYAFAPHWSVQLEYLYAQFGNAPMSASPQERSTIQRSTSSSSASASTARSIGRDRTAGTPKTDLTDPESDRWEIHGQTTYLGQGYPAFRAPYTGTNSLTPARQAQATWSNSLYLNARLWEGGEVYYNPELLQGFGLSDTVGLAGFSSGEAQKSNFPYPHYNTSRLYVRQTFGFGGEQEELASGQQQLAGKVDVNRLTLQAGKFSVGDVFDGNAYAKDTRKDFMNWSIWAPGAFDYAADKLGLTYGMTAELNQKNWALRGGYFLMGAVSNSNNFDTQVFRRGQYVAELETRYSLFSVRASCAPSAG